MTADVLRVQNATAAGRPTVMVVGARGIPDVEGGAEKNAEMLFPRIAAAGYRVVLFGLDGVLKGGSYRGVELRRAPNRRVLKTDKLFYYASAIFAARKIKPDIVHLQGLGASLFLWAYKMLGARVVVRYGSADYIVAKWGRIGRLGFRLAEYQTRYADAVIAVAPALARRLSERGIRDNVHVIANAVDEALPIEDAIPTEDHASYRPFILFVGRVTAQKNVHNVIAGFHLFAERTGTAYTLLVAGGLEDTPYVDGLQSQLNERVVLLGRCNRARLEGLYRDCAVFVNGSMHEGSSNAVLEAIGRGCPVVLSEIAENRDFGLMDDAYFDPASPEAIADALAAAAAAPDRFRVDRDRFMTWSTVTEKTLTIYRAILA